MQFAPRTAISIKAAMFLGGASIAIVAATPVQAQAAEAKKLNIPAQQLGTTLTQIGRETGSEIVFQAADVRGRQAPAVRGAMTIDSALDAALRGSGLRARRSAQGAYVIERESTMGKAPAADDYRGQEIVVTAQKRTENAQDVPISITALSQDDLTTRQVATGADLMTQVPNMTFTKTNFTGYSIQIRGIGTQAISATTDAAVAIAFNNSSFIRNRFFEQEFYDLERIEVLRGPQGTLYGRNATAGVVNLISAKPKFDGDAKLSIDIGNFGNRRVEGMINTPLVEDKVALRLAGAWTKRNGYTKNLLDGQDIDGRNLWSTRLSLLVEPTDTLRANFIWEHFSEDDDRMRSAKQLCKKDPGPSEVGGISIVGNDYGAFDPRSFFNQGCLPTSLYGEEAFQTPNGYALPFYGPTGNLNNNVFFGFDPYASTTQSRNLREIESAFRPRYQAKTDTLQFQLGLDITPDLTLTSETAYSHDALTSFQDYNRFNTKPGVFVENALGTRLGVLDENGIFCDPQLGCSSTLLLADYSTAKSKQYSQEIRVSSDFDEPFNFSLGANYLRYNTEDRYYVFVNSLSMLAAIAGGYQNDNPYISGVTDNMDCQNRPGRAPNPDGLFEVVPCIYIDPNPIESLNGQGRNYFLSRNPYKLTSYAVFGEAYYEVSDNLKITGGFRWTVDKKHAPQIPSWLLASNAVGEYPVAENTDQKWSEPTGRLAIDWRLTRDNLLYASFSHGYKAGGANPPPPVIATYNSGDRNNQALANLSHPAKFDAEYVNAFEIGSKNTFLDGRVTLNLAAFYYDYKGYQISQIINRSAVNLNFDAKVWGAEMEADWRPTDNLRLGFKGGYQGTKLAKGSGAIDTMDRTAGDPNYVLGKPFPTMTSNCILPVYAVTAGGELLGAKTQMGPCYEAYYLGLDIATGLPYVPNPTVRDNPSDPGGSTIPLGPNYAGYIGFDPSTVPNGGAGITKDLSGNELPNAPHFTGTITADYTIDLAKDWSATLHADLYFQSGAWTRVFNTPKYDRLKPYSNVNLAAVINNEAAGLQIMAYVKNVFDKTSLTGAFLNSDDTGLTTNVFLTEPRLFGLRVTKQWRGSSMLGNLFTNGSHKPGTPYPFEVEVGAGLGRFTSRHEVFVPKMAEEFQPSLPFPLSMQGDRLDRDNERDIKLTYAASNGWRISAGARFGETNARSRVEVIETTPGGVKSFPYLNGVPDQYREGLDNYGTSEMDRGEEHRIIDFMIGKDVGLGRLDGGHSTISVGLRYARFKSMSNLAMFGSPDNYIPEFNDSKYEESSYSLHRASLARSARFEGVGPFLSWAASKRLAGDETGGHLDLDWTLSGGVLFGKQRAAVAGEQIGLYTYTTENFPKTRVIDEARYDEAFANQRSQRVTVPTFGASLGLSYTVDRFKVGAGYRWEGYLGAVDAGIEQSKRYDRNMDGPFIKVSIGFGS